MCPLAVFDSGNVAAAADADPRQLIPGVEPGGSRAGQATKPCLLIKDAWAQLIVLTDANTTADMQEAEVRLKLSQEDDLSPGLVLPVAEFHGSKTATANLWNEFHVEQVFHAQGTIWAPRVVGLGIGGFVGGMDTLRWRVFLDYVQIDMPWMDWFIMWDFLDNVTNDSFEY